MSSKKFHILVAPLDWGIGHATRCVPIIRMLLQKGVDITVAAGGQPLAFLKLNFPEISYIKSEGFKVIYPSKGSMVLKMALSAPGFISDIYQEHQWLEKIIDEYEVDAVISDNRFGFYSRKVPCVYMTHQVVIRMPRGMRTFEPLTYFFHGRFIKQYTECWIPDLEGGINLSGDLSHQYPLPANASFIGPLSRFKEFQQMDLSENTRDVHDLLVMLSGPEPQRSILERKVRMELKNHPGIKAAMLQGMPGENGITEEHDGLKTYSHLPDHRIASLIKNSRMILCRPGYSTIMDLVSLKKTAVLVPTPGQTEQEYLGSYLAGKKWFHCINQNKLKLETVFKTKDINLTPMPDFQHDGGLEKRIDHLLSALS